MAIKYKELTSLLRKDIKNRQKRGINRLPSEQELCSRFAVSRQTVRHALSILEKEGLICKKKGSGSYITGLSAIPEENVIGILISDRQQYLYPSLLHAIDSPLTANGFSIQVFQTASRFEEERSILMHLLHTPLQGLLAESIKTALPNPNLSLYRKLLQNGTDIVFINHPYPELLDCPFLSADNFQGSQLLTHFLAEKGHKKIGTLFCIDTIEGKECYQGYTQACLDSGLFLCDRQNCWYQTADLEALRHSGNSRFMQELLENAFSDCSAIICQNDEISYSLIQEMGRKGISPKHDIEVVSFDHSYLCHYDGFSIPSLQMQNTGQLAAELMLQKRKGLPVSAQKIPWKLPY